MPTYEYKCDECGAEVEVRQTAYEDNGQQCKLCRSAMRKKFSVLAWQFDARMSSLEALE